MKLDRINKAEKLIAEACELLVRSIEDGEIPGSLEKDWRSANDAARAARSEIEMLVLFLSRVNPK